MLSRSASRLFHNRRHALTLGVMATAAATGGAALFLTSDKKVHAESNNQLKFWQSLPGENTPENPGFAKLRGMAAEQRFRTSLAQNNGKTDFDVVIGKFVLYFFFILFFLFFSANGHTYLYKYLLYMHPCTHIYIFINSGWWYHWFSYCKRIIEKISKYDCCST
jgi:hypothetical protein